ncbi:Peptidase S24/S26, beta-ribbon domain protein [Acididesulfobacillus acetoxydans]|uniref:Signal peptidase I n=1 Tax=Acididesulfobacillus acetoxydans TaxID=1561005 RepID=A0A8S0WGJ5_9FIRM|nr:signal peptidase I [Acididesulfobacillus acetoxydans]CAA7601942.1 Peptidase S24/S26, beta-ribbon domain protein [Acididesulfobacillus acetoxydans]CEJ08214.1 Signal peptidase I [Acididesulfobacillus acetoxydans]
MNVEEPRKSGGRFLLELVEIVLIAFVLSWAIRTYVIEARVIPTGSMLPTIQLQDRVIVDKFFFKYFDHIRRGDIIVFRPPAAAHSQEDFIKRVIGLPGDKIQIKDHKTYVNGKALYEPYLLAPEQGSYGPVVVPPGDLFVMGDNRNNSDDSRVWGFLPLKNVTGRALFRYWPLSRFGPLAK